jgi:hypothetical protein
MDNKVYELSGGEIDVWVDGGIMLKVRNGSNDPAELSEQDAEELGNLLLRLVKESRG